MANVLAFAETRAGALRKVALEAVTAAREIADATGGGEVHAVLAGAPGIAAKAPQLAEYGADVVWVVEHPALAQYNAETIAATVAERAKSGGYRALVFSSSVQGKDLAPRVGARLERPVVTDVTAFEPRSEAFVVRHPVNTGKVIATLAIAGTPAVIALRPAAVTAVKSARAGRVETMAPSGDPAASRVVVQELQQANTSRADLGDARVIVSGGRGLKAKENFALLDELAAAFGNDAAVGATRAVTDDGWRPHSDQIGQTGRTVSPELYVAVGISGAIQHLAGMRTSRVIVAINKDREAPIFKVADYGIVGDSIEIVKALTPAVRAARQAP